MRIFAILLIAILNLSLSFKTLVAAPRQQLDLTEQVSPNGFHFALANSNIQDVVAIALAMPCGLACDSPETYAAGAIGPTAAWHSGAGNLSASETYEGFKDFSTHLSFGANSDNFLLGLSAPSRGIEGAVKLTNELMLHPALKENAIIRLRSQLAQQFEESRLDDEMKSFIGFLRASADAAGYEHYFLPEPADIGKVTSTHIVDWLRLHLSTHGILISVVGDITPHSAGVLVDELLAHVPPTSLLGHVPGATFHSGGEIVELKGNGGAQAVVSFGASVAKPSTLTSWIGGRMLSAIFADGSKSRMFRDIREKIGATYGLQLDFNFYESLTMNRITGRIAEAKLPDAIAQMRKSWDDFRENGPTDIEAAEARAAMLNEINDISHDHMRFAETLRDVLAGHWSVDEIATIPSLIAQIDLKDKTLLTEFFPPNPIIVVVK